MFGSGAGSKLEKRRVRMAAGGYHVVSEDNGIGFFAVLSYNVIVQNSLR